MLDKSPEILVSRTACLSNIGKPRLSKGTDTVFVLPDGNLISFSNAFPATRTFGPLAGGKVELVTVAPGLFFYNKNSIVHALYGALLVAFENLVTFRTFGPGTNGITAMVVRIG